MTPEKIEDSPEFKKALNEACERQYRGWLYGGGIVSSKDKIGETMEEIQRQRREIEEKVEGAKRHADRLRREAALMSNPHAREITENLRRIHGQNGGLVCPQCGDTDHGNRMNGKPWCMRCNLPLMSKEKAEGWIKPSKPKPRSLTFTDVDRVVLKE